MLQELITQTNTVILNVAAKHQGSWTRVNRKNTKEKSIIDYIIVSQNMIENIIESATDDDDIYLIEGTNPTDHRVITATINTRIKTNKRIIKKWKEGSPDKWAEFNKELQNIWQNTNPILQDMKTLQQAIIKSLETKIGSNKIQTNQKHKITNPQIKEAKAEKKRLRNDFNKACKENSSNKNETKIQYLISQTKVRNLMEQQQRHNVAQTVNQIIQEGGANSKTFWTIRKKLLNHNKNDEYETIDENDKKIIAPTQARNHIADYFEKLYCAREGEESHKNWTDHINKCVEEMSQSNEKSKNEKPFSQEELNKCIKTLKRRKSTGPDRIPNEIFIEADENTKKIYLQNLNKIYDHEKIPTQWQHGEIIRIYKGKGKKGKCSNERGITLASNMGKVFERLMNNRIKEEVTTTEAQAGGQPGSATADHIIILNSLINQMKKKKKKELYIIFLDVTKAYDKAWLNSIMYTMHKSGLRGKNWRIVKALNSDLTATIKTKYGPTRKITIKDSIRQGGVLSVI